MKVSSFPFASVLDKVNQNHLSSDGEGARGTLLGASKENEDKSEDEDVEIEINTHSQKYGLRRNSIAKDTISRLPTDSFLEIREKLKNSA